LSKDLIILQPAKWSLGTEE